MSNAVPKNLLQEEAAKRIATTSEDEGLKSLRRTIALLDSGNLEARLDSATRLVGSNSNHPEVHLALVKAATDPSPKVSKIVQSAVWKIGIDDPRIVPILIDNLKTREGVESAQNVLRRFADKLTCLLYTSPSPRDATLSRMPSSA